MAVLPFASELTLACLMIFHTVTAFHTTGRIQRIKYSTRIQSNFLGDLWEEIIEFSTLGPSERKLLKARRAEGSSIENEKSMNVQSFQRTESNNKNIGEERNDDDDDDDDAWLEAFSAAKTGAPSSPISAELDFDGYALRDILVNKWRVPLDVDFQRQPGRTIYCTVLPVLGYGSNRSRHNSELDYLMHLQGVVEILQKYNNLELFTDFIETTTKIPKQGTDSVPFRLQLSAEELEKISPKI